MNMLPCSFVAVAALAIQALSFPLHDLPTRDADLDVQLRSVGNTLVKAIITNNGDREISLLNRNSFLDPAPVNKVQISKDGKRDLLLNCVHRITPS